MDRAIAFGLEHGAKTPEALRMLSAAKLIRRLRSVMLSGNWEWVGGVLSDARGMKDALPVCSLKELQVRVDVPALSALRSVYLRACWCSLRKMNWMIAASCRN